MFPSRLKINHCSLKALSVIIMQFSFLAISSANFPTSFTVPTPKIILGVCLYPSILLNFPRPYGRGFNLTKSVKLTLG